MSRPQTHDEPEHCAGQELLPLELAAPAPAEEAVEEPPLGPPPLFDLAPPPDRANRVSACVVHDGLLLVVARVPGAEDRAAFASGDERADDTDGDTDDEGDDLVPESSEAAAAPRGGWLLPGGAVRRGESRRHAVARLVRESTWVRVEAGTRGVTVTGTTGARMSCFPGLVVVQADPLAPGAAWVDPDEAPWSQDPQIAQLREHGLLETLLV